MAIVVNSDHSTDPVVLPHPALGDSADVVSSVGGFAIGAALFFDSSAGYVKAANALTWTTDLLTTQKNFAAKFVGLASVAVDINSARSAPQEVYSGGLIEVPCVAGTYNPGDYLSLAKQSGNALDANTFQAVTDPDAAIAVVARPTGALATSVWVKLQPRLLGRGVEREIGDVAFTLGAEVSDVRQVTIQLKDKFGQNLTGVRTVRVFLSDSATVGVTADVPDGGVAAVADYGTARILTADADFLVTTTVAGVAKLDIEEAGADSWYVNVLANDRLFTSAVLTFAA